MASQLDRIRAAGDVLGSPLKVAILYLLARQESANMTEIAAELGITRPSVHRALAALRESGLVDSHAEPPHFRPIAFRLNRPAVEALLETVSELLPARGDTS